MIESQNKTILKYLQTHDGISPKDAEELCGCMRLASRISDIKKKYNARITRTLHRYIDSNGRRRHYAFYSLEADDEQ